MIHRPLDPWSVIVVCSRHLVEMETANDAILIFV